MTHRVRRWRRRGIISSIGLVSVALAFGATAALAGGGVKGDPQPELNQFSIGNPGGGAGTGAVLSDGNLVLAAPTSSGTSIRVCVLHPGSRACVSNATLNAYTGGGGDSFYGTVEVLATGGQDISVVAEDCCYLNVGGDNGGAVVFDSTNGGATFGPEIPAGTIDGIGTATFAGGDIVVANDTTGTFQVQAFPVDPGSAVTAMATPPSSDGVGTSSLTTYHGGVLLTWDNLTNTFAEYAPSGSDFNSTDAYGSVGTFTGQDVSAVSGNALLTDPGGSLTGGEKLRFFNGSSFGPAYSVPDSKAGDDGAFTMQEVGNVAHVFFIGRRDSYDVLGESTANGTSWSGQTQYTVGSAIDAGLLSPVLGPTGAGLVVQSDEEGGVAVIAQPVLLAQGVHVVLGAVRLKVGHTTTLHGTVGPRLPGQAVTLERLDAGLWYPVSVSHETATGTFTFKIPAVTRTYRVVVNEKLGYYEYGYSNAVTLVAVK
jgi:hypothetical protein